MVKHYGPLQISIYADGYTRIGQTACGNIDIDSESMKDVTSKLTFHPLEVQCEKCRSTKAYKSSSSQYENTGRYQLPSEPQLIPHMRTAVAKAGGKFDIEASRELRRFVGISEGMPTKADLRKIWQFEHEKQVDYAERSVARLETALAEAREKALRMRSGRIKADDE